MSSHHLEFLFIEDYFEEIPLSSKYELRGSTNFAQSRKWRVCIASDIALTYNGMVLVSLAWTTVHFDSLTMRVLFSGFLRFSRVLPLSPSIFSSLYSSFSLIFSCGITCYQYPINISAPIQHGSWCRYLLWNLIIYIPHAIASLTNFVHTGTPSLRSSLRVYFSLFIFLFQYFLRLRFFSFAKDRECK